MDGRFRPGSDRDGLDDSAVGPVEGHSGVSILDQARHDGQILDISKKNGVGEPEPGRDKSPESRARQDRDENEKPWTTVRTLTTIRGHGQSYSKFLAKPRQ